MSVIPEDIATRNPAPPSKRLLLAELRALAEWPRAVVWLPTRHLPRGDGHPVMVLPGFGASDRATAPLRRALRRLDYRVEGWGQGRNLGMRREIGQALSARIEALHDAHGAVSLIGWSLGGVFARELARSQPQRIRRVITLGSPISHHPKANNMERLFQLANPRHNGEVDWDAFTRRETPPPVACTAIYTESDGVVAARCCRELPAPHTENVRVRGSHMGLPANPAVLEVIATRLMQPPRAPE
ncbi:alpha/beta fold hydrolase [Algiphilus sp.]|uniref:esterase/lipase family protein n=1 Tax=Algiphilus sp. TaxID=1872431 RepID=UPI0032ECC2BD